MEWCAPVKRVVILSIGVAAGFLAGCSGDPYPAMHLEPVQEVSLGMSPGRVVYGTLYGAQNARTSRMGLPLTPSALAPAE